MALALLLGQPSRWVPFPVEHRTVHADLRR
jgi:hypothetical protein